MKKCIGKSSNNWYREILLNEKDVKFQQNIVAYMCLIPVVLVII